MTDAVPPIRPSRETIGERRLVHGHSTIPGGSPTYRSWMSMRNRCNNSATPAYQRYGALGIVHCPTWSSFKNFLRDMGERPSLLHSLDRYPNRSGNYEPGNCRWATHQEQRLNQKRTRAVRRSDGKIFASMLEAAAEIGARSSDVSAVCLGKQKTCRGFGFEVLP